MGHPKETHINYLDKSKSSPLHLAVRGGNVEAIRYCIANGGKVDQQQVPQCPTKPQFTCWQQREAPCAFLCQSVPALMSRSCRDGSASPRPALVFYADLHAYMIITSTCTSASCQPGPVYLIIGL